MYEELFLKAKEVRKNAYAPYSNFTVGAALLTKEGKVYTGVNIENSSYPTGICAERVAFGNAVTAGERDFEAIAIVGGQESCLPCGMCRQFIYELAKDIIIITGDDENHLKTHSIKELLPEAFSL